MPRVLSGRRKRRSKSRRRDPNFVAIPFADQLALGTLNADTVVKVQPLTFGEDLFVLSVDVAAALRDGVATEGPLEVGLAHGDLTVAEVEENLQAEVTDPDDIIARERSRRPVRRLGTFPGLSTHEVIHGGEPLRLPCRFSVGDGHGLSFWAANRSGSALTVGAANLRFHGTIFGLWQR